MGLSFDVVGGDVARLVLTFESARALVESLQDVLVRPEAPAGLDELPISDEAQARVNLWRAETCGVMRARMVALGLPDCVGGFVYREELL